MKMCSDHWDALKQAIDKRGLTKYIAKDAQAAGKRIQHELEGTESPDDFDPLMSATWAIYGHATNLFGLVIISLKNDGAERCPLCMLAESWIELAADEAKAYVDQHLEADTETKDPIQ